MMPKYAPQPLDGLPCFKMEQINQLINQWFIHIAAEGWINTFRYRITGIRGLMRGMATLPQGNQELLVVKDKVGRPPGELGVSKSMECDIFPSVLDTFGWVTGRASGL